MTTLKKTMPQETGEKKQSLYFIVFSFVSILLISSYSSFESSGVSLASKSGAELPDACKAFVGNNEGMYIKDLDTNKFICTNSGLLKMKSGENAYGEKGCRWRYKDNSKNRVQNKNGKFIGNTDDGKVKAASKSKHAADVLTTLSTNDVQIETGDACQVCISTRVQESNATYRYLIPEDGSVIKDEAETGDTAMNNCTRTWQLVKSPFHVDTWADEYLVGAFAKNSRVLGNADSPFFYQFEQQAIWWNVESLSYTEKWPGPMKCELTHIPECDDMCGEGQWNEFAKGYWCCDSGNMESCFASIAGVTNNNAFNDSTRCTPTKWETNLRCTPHDTEEDQYNNNWWFDEKSALAVVYAEDLNRSCVDENRKDNKNCIVVYNKCYVGCELGYTFQYDQRVYQRACVPGDHVKFKNITSTHENVGNACKKSGGINKECVNSETGCVDNGSKHITVPQIEQPSETDAYGYSKLPKYVTQPNNKDEPKDSISYVYIKNILNDKYLCVKTKNSKKVQLYDQSFIEENSLKSDCKWARGRTTSVYALRTKGTAGWIMTNYKDGKGPDTNDYVGLQDWDGYDIYQNAFIFGHNIQTCVYLRNYERGDEGGFLYSDGDGDLRVRIGYGPFKDRCEYNSIWMTSDSLGENKYNIKNIYT